MPMIPLTLPIETATTYYATLQRFQDELVTRWGATEAVARQALYLMLVPGLPPYGWRRVVLGEHVSAVKRLAHHAGLEVILVQVGAEAGLALPPQTGAIREAWPGPVLF